MTQSELLTDIAEKVGYVKGSIDQLHQRVDRLEARIGKMGPINGIIRLWKEARPLALVTVVVILTMFGISVDNVIESWSRLNGILINSQPAEASHLPSGYPEGPTGGN